MALPEEAGTGIDTTLPHSARIWNYWLGGGVQGWVTDPSATDGRLVIEARVNLSR